MNNAIQDVKRTGFELFLFLVICITIIFTVLFSSLSHYEARTQVEEVTQSTTGYDPLTAEREAAKKRNPLAK